MTDDVSKPYNLREKNKKRTAGESFAPSDDLKVAANLKVQSYKRPALRELPANLRTSNKPTKPSAKPEAIQVPVVQTAQVVPAVSANAHANGKTQAKSTQESLNALPPSYVSLSTTETLPLRANLCDASPESTPNGTCSSTSSSCSTSSVTKTLLASPLSRMNLTEEEPSPDGPRENLDTIVLDYVDIDYGREESPAHCTSYIQEIYDYLRIRETHFRPEPDFLLNGQTDVTVHMRAVLIDWLVEVTEEYNLCSETLYLAKNYVDRYLALKCLPVAELQLLGATCIMIAAKMEEVDIPPTVEDYVFLCDGTYEKEHIVQMEMQVLSMLKWNLAMATEKTFLRRYQRAAAAHVQNRNLLSKIVMLSNYLTELTMQDYQFLRYFPSKIATAAVCLALYAYELEPWSSTMEYYTKYKWEDLLDCMRGIVRLYQTNHGPSARVNLRSVRKKFSGSKFMGIAKAPLPVREPPPNFA